MNALASVLMYAVLGLCLLVWIALILRICRGKPIMAQRESAPPRWGMLGIGFALAVWVISQVGIIVAVVAASAIFFGNPEQLPITAIIVGSSVAWVVAMLVCVAFLILAGAANLRELGLRWPHWASDIRSGLVAFFALSPPVLLFSMFLHWWFEPSGMNPLVDLLMQDADEWTWIVSIMAAVVVAPVAEEFFFRGILQGGLQGLIQRRRSTANLAETELHETPTLPEDAWPAELTPEQLPAPPLANDENPYQFGQATAASEVDPSVAPLPMDKQAMWGPIVVSSLIFSVAHWGNALDPVPLFGLALGLGYLYHRTQSLLPCIVLHAANNGFSLLMFWLTLE